MSSKAEADGSLQRNWEPHTRCTRRAAEECLVPGAGGSRAVQTHRPCSAVSGCAFYREARWRMAGHRVPVGRPPRARGRRGLTTASSPSREGRPPWGPHTPSTRPGSVPACDHGATDSDVTSLPPEAQGASCCPRVAPTLPPPTLSSLHPSSPLPAELTGSLAAIRPCRSPGRPFPGRQTRGLRKWLQTAGPTAHMLLSVCLSVRGGGGGQSCRRDG